MWRGTKLCRVETRIQRKLVRCVSSLLCVPTGISSSPEVSATDGKELCRRLCQKSTSTADLFRSDALSVKLKMPLLKVTIPVTTKGRHNRLRDQVRYSHFWSVIRVRLQREAPFTKYQKVPQSSSGFLCSRCSRTFIMAAVMILNATEGKRSMEGKCEAPLGS
jgi:hypothetical protein